MSDFRAESLGKASMVGTFAAIPHPVAIEVTAQAGVDFICIDWEHGADRARPDRESGARRRMSAACRPWCACRATRQEAIAAALDSRRAGVLVPRVSTAEQAAAAVKATRYPPLGERGVGPGRAAGYGYRISEYLAAANEESLLAVQVETAEGLANVDAIAATDGVDVVFVGPGDLSVSTRRDGTGRRGRSSARRSKTIRAATLKQAQENRRHLLRQTRGCRRAGPARAPASSSSPATPCSSVAARTAGPEQARTLVGAGDRGRASARRGQRDAAPPNSPPR